MVKGKNIFLCLFVIITLNIHAQETRNYVLTQDIVYTTHTPIMNPDGTAFTGNFYGNGHTIIIRGFAPGVTNNFGLFGEVGTGAVIRDLTVVYETASGGAVTISPASGGRFGGIAGTVSGGARFENVLVKGAVVVSGSGEVTVGGMVGRITSTATSPKATITNAYGGLNLTVNRNGYVGGVVGMIGTSTTTGAVAELKGITVVGNITVGISTSRVNGILYTGGLAGSVIGVGTGTSLSVFDDVKYKTGTITINKGTGDDWIGGAIGFIGGNTDIKDCVALADNFNINKTTSNNFYVGGFVGRIENTGNIIRNCYSENPLILTVGNISSVMAVGGFVGYLSADIAYCYAKGDISSNLIAGFVGGFVGYSISSSITFCFATGNVSIIRNSVATTNFSVGGFGGRSSGYVANNYSLGNVYIDTISEYDFFAGGFVARDEGSGNMENCFALGNVIANRNSTSGTTYIGGLVGRQSSTIRNCVIAVPPNNVNTGMSITATGGATRSIGRIYGLSSTSRPCSDNYAWNGLRLYSDNTYSRPDYLMTPMTVTGTTGNQHGADATSGFFRIASNWTGLGYTADVTIDSVSYPAWDFLGIEGRGYPRIRHPSGVGVLGGQ